MIIFNGCCKYLYLDVCKGVSDFLQTQELAKLNRYEAKWETLEIDSVKLYKAIHKNLL